MTASSRAARVMSLTAAILMYVSAALLARMGHPAWPLMLAAGLLFQLGGWLRSRPAREPGREK